MPSLCPIRRALDSLSPWDLESVQHRAIRRANDDILRHGRVTSRMWLVCQDHIEDIDLSAVTDGDPVATFDRLATRSDVEHRIAWGSVEGGGEHVAFVFGAANDEVRSWWLAVRGFRRLPGGLGSQETSWELTLGVAHASADGPLAPLRRPGPPLELLPARPVPFPEIGVRVDDVPANAEVPGDAVATTNVLCELGEEATAMRDRPDGVLVVVFRGRTFERWRLIGEIPCGLDDLVRAICARGPTPAAVATLCVDLFEYEGRLHRAVKTTGEAGGIRFERILAMLFAEGDGDQPSQLQYFGSTPADVGTDGWIGVAPVSALEWFDRGPEAS